MLFNFQIFFFFFHSVTKLLFGFFSLLWNNNKAYQSRHQVTSFQHSRCNSQCIIYDFIYECCVSSLIVWMILGYMLMPNFITVTCLSNAKQMLKPTGTRFGYWFVRNVHRRIRQIPKCTFKKNHNLQLSTPDDGSSYSNLCIPLNQIK